MRGLIRVCVLLIGAITLVKAQDTPNNIKKGALDFSIPDSPAATILGVSTNSVAKPTTPRGLAAALLNGFDQNGNFQTGISLDVAPYMLAYGGKVSLNTYEKRYVVRFLSRFQTSVATTKGTSDDKSAKIGLGFQATLFDFGDPRMNKGFLMKLDDAANKGEEIVKARRIAAGKNPLPDPNDSEDQKDYITQKTAEVNRLIDPLITSQKKSAWNRSSWIIAGAPSWSSPDGTSSNLSWNGAGVWTSLSYGFENVPGLRDSSQIIVHARMHNQELVPTSAITGTTPTAGPVSFLQNSWLTGARAVIGSPDTHFSFEYVYLHTVPTGFPEDDFSKLNFGIEKKLADNLWLSVGAGGESGKQNGKSKLLILTSFKWGTSSKAAISTGP